MYCPRCSQEQFSEDLRFCSRCGFPLSLVAEVVAGGGQLPQLAALGEKKNFLTRRNGLIFALFWFIFFAMILAPLCDAVLHSEELAAGAAIIGTMGGLLMVFASFLLLKKQPQLLGAFSQSEDFAHRAPKNFAAKNRNALPPEQSIPVSAYYPQTQAGWRDTKDLIQPSVTENTTRLLEKDEN